MGGGSVKELKSKEELDNVCQSGATVILHFWASWCEASNHMYQVFSHLSTDFPHAHFFTVRFFLLFFKFFFSYKNKNHWLIGMGIVGWSWGATWNIWGLLCFCCALFCLLQGIYILLLFSLVFILCIDRVCMCGDLLVLFFREFKKLWFLFEWHSFNFLNRGLLKIGVHHYFVERVMLIVMS